MRFIEFSIKAWSLPSLPSFIPYKNWSAKFLADLKSGYFDIASLNLTPRSQISLASCLCALRLDTFNGRVNKVASYYSVPLAVEALNKIIFYFIKKGSYLNQLWNSLCICLIQLFRVEFYTGLDREQINDSFHELNTIFFFIDIIWDIWLRIIFLGQPV